MSRPADPLLPDANLPEGVSDGAPDGPALARDLEADEASLARLLAAPPGGVGGPRDLKSRLLAQAHPPQPPVPERRGPTRGWILAASGVAVVLLALGGLWGAGVFDDPPAERPAARTPWTPDPSLSGFHDVETFESLGLEPDDLLATDGVTPSDR